MPFFETKPINFTDQFNEDNHEESISMEQPNIPVSRW